VVIYIIVIFWIKLKLKMSIYLTAFFKKYTLVNKTMLFSQKIDNVVVCFRVYDEYGRMQYSKLWLWTRRPRVFAFLPPGEASAGKHPGRGRQAGRQG
jgi:hypothetical protein